MWRSRWFSRAQGWVGTSSIRTFWWDSVLYGSVWNELVRLHVHTCRSSLYLRDRRYVIYGLSYMFQSIYWYRNVTDGECGYTRPTVKLRTFFKISCLTLENWHSTLSRHLPPTSVEVTIVALIIRHLESPIPLLPSIPILQVGRFNRRKKFAMFSRLISRHWTFLPGH